MVQTETIPQPLARRVGEGTSFAILLALSFSHLLNDLIQSLIPAIYPLLKDSFDLNFMQIGLITLTFQLTASLLQPLVGLYTDRHPQPFSLAAGMGFTLLGLFLLATAGSFSLVLLAAALVGIGSSVFHPESSRMARAASGGRHGLAQSLFQVGGNAGSAIGPLLAAFIVVPGGQGSVAWFSIAALVAIVLLFHVDLFWTAVLTVPIGLVLASAFSAILVYAQELLPRRVGLVAGLFFGFAFGMAGLGAAVLGELADLTSIGFVYRVCSFLPLIGVMTAFLPNLERKSAALAVQ